MRHRYRCCWRQWIKCSSRCFRGRRCYLAAFDLLRRNSVGNMLLKPNFIVGLELNDSFSAGEMMTDQAAKASLCNIKILKFIF